MKFSPITFIGSHFPYYYSSFVSTIDGKVMVKKDGYWPLGSEKDFQYFTYLRTFADVIIDGKQTSLGFGDRTITRIHDEDFQTQRALQGKSHLAEYMILTSNPEDALIPVITNQWNYKPYLVTTPEAQLSAALGSLVRVVRIPANSSGKVDLLHFHEYLKHQQFKHIFIDGGALLLGSFLSEHLLDELFLTITPKVVGTEYDTTISLVEGTLFTPENIKQAELISVEKIQNEVFLRYVFPQ